jgi:hypothetical protein
MIINGRFAAEEIWVNLLTPERIAESERDYQSKRREERRRIDMKFESRSIVKRYAQPTMRFNRPSPEAFLALKRQELAIEQTIVANQKRLLDFILE